MANVKNYRKQGGEEWVISGDLTVESGGKQTIESGGEVDFESGSDFKIAGSKISSSAEELNKVSGDKIVKSKIVNIAYDDDDIDTGIDVLALAAGEALLSLECRVTTAWDSGTSDGLSIGHGASLNEFVDGQDAQSTGLVTKVSGAIPPAISESETAIKVKVASEGTAASQGEAEIIVTYTA